MGNKTIKLYEKKKQKQFQYILMKTVLFCVHFLLVIIAF